MKDDDDDDDESDEGSKGKNNKKYSGNVPSVKCHNYEEG